MLYVLISIGARRTNNASFEIQPLRGWKTLKIFVRKIVFLEIAKHETLHKYFVINMVKKYILFSQNYP